jgi:hypothetical protein
MAQIAFQEEKKNLVSWSSDLSQRENKILEEWEPFLSSTTAGAPILEILPFLISERKQICNEKEHLADARHELEKERIRLATAAAELKERQQALDRRAMTIQAQD